MSKCKEYQMLISAMLDGELPQADAQRLQAHIAECDDCRAMYQAFQALSAAVTADTTVPESLHENIMSTVRAADHAQRAQKKLTRLRSYLALAACLVLAVGTVFALNSSLFRMGKSSDAALYNNSAAPMEPGSGQMFDDREAVSAEMAPSGDAADNAYSFGLDTPQELPMPATKDGMATAVPQRLTLEVTELAEDRLTGTVVSSGFGLFAEGQEITVMLSEAEADLDVSHMVGSTLTVEFDHWEDGVIYARTIQTVE